MTTEMITAIVDEMPETAYDMISAEYTARTEAQWHEDTETAMAHEARLTALLAEYGLTLAEYELTLTEHVEDDDWDDGWDD